MGIQDIKIGIILTIQLRAMRLNCTWWWIILW